MAEVARTKVGIIACSGEEIPGGTISRLAALRVLESLRPHETVTICLPLFLAGGEGDRAFARFHPTIAVDGCDKRCAARGTEMLSGKPAVSIVVKDRIGSTHLGAPRQLSAEGMKVVRDVSEEIVRHVDRLLGRDVGRHDDRGMRPPQAQRNSEAKQATCSCGSGIPVTVLRLDGREVTFVALPLIFAQFREAGKLPNDATKVELIEAAKIYNPIADEDETACADLILEEYRTYCQRSH